MKSVEAALIVFLLTIGHIIADEWTYRVVRNCPLEEYPGDPRKYYHRGSFGERFERQCPPELIFVLTKCTCDVRPLECDLRPSSSGAIFYDQYAYGRWVTMRCAPGTIFNEAECACSSFLHEGR